MNNPFESIEVRLSNIENLIHDIKHKGSKESLKEINDQWFDLNELVEYDPEKRTKPTFYGYIHRGEIPYHKRGKKLTFLKSEIDEWLKSGRRKTNSEIEDEAESYLKKKGL